MLRLSALPRRGAADLFSSADHFRTEAQDSWLLGEFPAAGWRHLEGVLPHNLLEWPALGFLFTPPRSSAYRQRVFMPRQAVSETVLRGTVGSAAFAAGKPAKKGRPSEAASPTLHVRLGARSIEASLEARRVLNFRHHRAFGPRAGSNPPKIPEAVATVQPLRRSGNAFRPGTFPKRVRLVLFPAWPGAQPGLCR